MTSTGCWTGETGSACSIATSMVSESLMVPRGLNILIINNYKCREILIMGRLGVMISTKERDASYYFLDFVLEGSVRIEDK